MDEERELTAEEYEKIEKDFHDRLGLRLCLTVSMPAHEMGEAIREMANGESILTPLRAFRVWTGGGQRNGWNMSQDGWDIFILSTKALTFQEIEEIAKVYG